MNKFVFPIIIGLTAFSLAAMSAYCSITGLEKIFDGWQILVIASVIELGKIVSVSVLYRLWKEMGLWKLLLIPMTVAVMLITSFGVYGFLSSTYEKKASEMRIGDSRIELEEARKTSINERIKRYNDEVKVKSDRVNGLIKLREQQENRVDSLYARNMSRAAKEAQNSIKEASLEVENLNKEIQKINELIEQDGRQYASTDSSIVMMKYQNSKGEIGTLKYISNISGTSVDVVANFLMLLLIFVFDPLAVVLIVAFNISWNKSLSEDNDKEVQKNDDSIKELNHQEESIEEKIDYPMQQSNSIEEDVESKEEFVEMNKEPEVIDVYRENESVEFVKSEESKIGEIKEIEKEENKDLKEIYLKLLKALYMNGSLMTNDHIMPYNKFLREIQLQGIECTRTQIESFLSLCVMRKIIFLSEKLKYALKSYDEAVEIISKETIK